MTDILPLLLDKKPVPEYLLGFWCIAMQNNIPVLDTQFFLQTILPVYRRIGQTAVRREDLAQHRAEHAEFVDWLLSVPEDITHAVAMLTSDDDRRVVIFFDREGRRAEVLNSTIEEIVPPPLCDELSQAALWVGRLLLRKLFIYWSASPQVPKETWEHTASPMMYIYLRLCCGMVREHAGREVSQKGVTEFLQHFRLSVEQQQQSVG